MFASMTGLRRLLFVVASAAKAQWYTVSGKIVTFITNLVSPLFIEATIDPVQSGSGDPYPAGGGKNKLDADTVYSDYKQSDGSFVLTGTQAAGIKTYIPQALVGQSLVFSASCLIPSGSSVTNIRLRAVVNGENISSTYVATSSYTRTSVAFTPVSTNDYIIVTYGSGGSGTIQFKDAMLEIGSTVSAYAPYSNIRPISGWTGCNVSRTGKNLFDKNATDTSKGYVANGYLQKTGLEYYSSNYRISEYIALEPNKSYLIQNAYGGAPSYCLYDANKSFIEGAKYANRTSFSITTGASVAYCRVSLYGASDGNINTFSIAECNVYEITWQSTAGTVYGGTLTVNTDGTVVLTETHKRVDLGSFSWVKLSNGSKAYAIVSGMKTTDSTEKYDIICDSYKSATWGENVCAICHFNNIIRISNPAFADMTGAQIGTALDGVYAVYPLATPVTYTLTSQEIDSFLGQNVVWADTGDVTVKYLADPTLWARKVL